MKIRIEHEPDCPFIKLKNWDCTCGADFLTNPRAGYAQVIESFIEGWEQALFHQVQLMKFIIGSRPKGDQ